MFLSCRMRLLLPLLTCVTLLGSGSLQAQDYFRYPPYGAQRGRMVYRDGLFHSERYRWGNGLTPQGAQVLTHAIDVVGPLLPVLVGGATGREADDGTRAGPDCSSRSAVSSIDHYAREQARANELLARTAKLVDPNFQASPGSGIGGASGANTNAPGSADASSANLLQQLKQEYGVEANPWGIAPSAANPTPQTQDEARRLMEALRRAYELTGENPWKASAE